MTFSIVARSADGESWGVAVASKFLAVGAVVPAAVAQVGAIATQANANVAYKGLTLAHLDDGATAPVALQRLLEEDEGRDERQVGIVDLDGGSASHTGQACIEWAGSLTGEGYAIQGNCLTGSEVVEAMEAVWLAGEDLPFERRLLEALAAGDEAGGDKRGRQSAALLVVERDGGYAGLSDTLVDLRVDDHADPLGELRRLHRLHDALFGRTPRDRWLTVDDALRTELHERLARAGHDSLASWAGVENLEERVDGEEAIDPVVLERLREAT